MKQPAIRFAFAALVLSTLASSAAGALGATGSSSIKFEALGPAGLKINGDGAGIETTEADGKITIKAKTTDLHTGIGLRDKHLREHIEADKFPSATLVVDRAKVSLPASGKADGTMTLPLTFHGVTRPTKVTYTLTKSASGYHVDGSFELNIIEHGVKKPCYLGVCVGDVVKVSAAFDVQGG